MLLLVLLLVGPAAVRACSCAWTPDREYLCNARPGTSILKVRIDQVVWKGRDPLFRQNAPGRRSTDEEEEERAEGLEEGEEEGEEGGEEEEGESGGTEAYTDYKYPPTGPTTVAPSTTDISMGRRRVNATIEEVFLGDVEVEGDTIEIESGMEGAMCGIGWSLTPGIDIILATENTNFTELNMCQYWRTQDHTESYMDRSFEALEEMLRSHDCGCEERSCTTRFGRRMFKGRCGDPTAYCARNHKGKCKWRGAESLGECTRPYSGY